MHYVGIDVGSTSTKVAVMDEARKLADTFLCPTGFSSVDAAQRAQRLLVDAGYDVRSCAVAATGYGRVAVPYAAHVVTEITCHGKGAAYLFGCDGTVIDVGGQDTKVIVLVNGSVKKFVMNDKCSAGTGRFLEIMADRLAVTQDELARLARLGHPTPISSMCTVFAESEVISLVGRGESRENIANGVIESVVARVASLASQMGSQRYYLTGGLCDNGYVVERLSACLKSPVRSVPEARFAGAVGAALCAHDAAHVASNTCYDSVDGKASVQ
ncbi:acyl-CoA dehydratase activase [Raoultibacter phocaeensis]|uniref:acyl-CoA dehydratase activase n=1 Tax=Raoultibacter phocaeensis TaxID=2479841 RepID=UPI001119EA80|nr:acyl-CoA dehydratase activase [Raoultibacter phocaeensis]